MEKIEESLKMKEKDIVAPPPVKLVSSRKPMRRGLFAVTLVLFCFAVGFGGSALFWYSGLASSIQIINRDKIVMQEGEVVAEVAKDVGPSVVSIVTESTARTIFGYSTLQQGAGTGIIISKDGYIVTNKHVVSSSDSNVEIILADGTSYKDVKYIGSDPTNDIAFLKIQNVDNLTPATLGDSSSVQVGQKVVAIGNALGEYQNTVTTGIISALSRPVTAAADSSGTGAESLENLLQTDAAINPGNSGGPLVNLSGEIIGITTAVATDAEGIGFAIPINDVKGMVKTLLAEGKVVKPYIGIRYVSITPAVVKEFDLKVKKGALIYGDENEPAVVAGSPAEISGLKEGDIISMVGKTAVDGQHPFASLIAQYSPNDKVEITYLRDGKEAKVTVTVGARS